MTVRRGGYHEVYENYCSDVMIGRIRIRDEDERIYRTFRYSVRIGGRTYYYMDIATAACELRRRYDEKAEQAGVQEMIC